ncbi:inner-membrane translocator [Pelagibacterales bacterium SAG-MED31]|nr:inner-membrane translocator [Pelagibacterales bacterium SAG-MED31]
MIKDKTGVQLNSAHTATDDFITKKYILPLLQDEETRNRLIAEHKATPVGRAPNKGNPAVEHSKDLITVLDKLRRHPMAGKYVTICKNPFEDYRIGICSGIRGVPVEILEDSFSSEEACEHAIFLKRVFDLLEKYS